MPAAHTPYQAQIENIFTVNATTGAISVTSGELDFDNPADANRDNKYHLDAHYTAGGETVTEQVVLNVTDRAAITAASTTGSSKLTVTEAETFSFNAAGPQELCLMRSKNS